MATSGEKHGQLMEQFYPIFLWLLVNKRISPGQTALLTSYITSRNNGLLCQEGSVISSVRRS